MRALEVCAQADDGRIENGLDRPPEAEAEMTAILPALDLDRRGPLEHKTAKTRVKRRAHRSS
jgi:hypothetical protein